MKCICESMSKADIDMSIATYKSVDYNGFSLYENYGVWRMQFQNDARQSVEIFYCPFCGKKLNRWHWAKNRRKEILRG